MHTARTNTYSNVLTDPHTYTCTRIYTSPHIHTPKKTTNLVFAIIAVPICSRQHGYLFIALIASTLVVNPLRGLAVGAGKYRTCCLSLTHWTDTNPILAASA